MLNCFAGTMACRCVNRNGPLFLRYPADGRLLEDEVGLELDSLEQAQAEAALSLTEMARDGVWSKLQQKLSVEVRDEKGEVLFDVFLTLEAKRRHLRVVK